MSKPATLFTLALLLSFGLIYASRPNLALNGVSSLPEDVGANKAWRAELDDQNCQGIKEETEECLIRRTLAAHTDYIYTQRHKPRDWRDSLFSRNKNSYSMGNTGH